MKRANLLVSCALIGSFIFTAGWAAEASSKTSEVPENLALLGSASFHPSPATPLGYRGDGTGKYPGANPPLHWSRTCKQMSGFKCLAAPAKDNPADKAESASLGLFTEWLVAGPLKSEDLVKAIKELTPDEAKLAPVEGDKIGDVSWKTIKVEDSYIDLWSTFGPMTKEQYAFAQTCLYTEEPKKIWFQFCYDRGAAFWLNGVLKYSNAEQPGGYFMMGPTMMLDLKKGWNRFLFKLTPRFGNGNYFSQDYVSECYVRCHFWLPDEPREFLEKNIAWISPMPGLSHAMPVIVGDRIYTTAAPYNLVCADKKTGKILWIRQNSPYDAATEDDRKAKPDLFTKMNEVAAKRDAYYRDYVASRPGLEAVKAEAGIEDELDKLMLEVDPKYKKPQEQEPEWWEIPTPVSDGKNVCLWMTRGVAACYDADGKRRWIRYQRPQHQHHGFFGSPVIADGKLIIYDGNLTALDLADGSVRFSLEGAKIRHPGYNAASLSRVVFAQTEYVLPPGAMDVVRARDGQIFGVPGLAASDATPLFCENTVVSNFQGGGHIFELKTAADGGVAMPGRTDCPAVRGLQWPQPCLTVPGLYAGTYLESSPLIHNGLLYELSCSGVLAVFDTATAQMIYRKQLPLDILGGGMQRNYVAANLAMAGNYVYITGPSGVIIVIKPGRQYEEVARNRIQFLAKSGRAFGGYAYFIYNTPPVCNEYQESTMTSTPIFDGTRMYFRGEENLYCIEER